MRFLPKKDQNAESQKMALKGLQGHQINSYERYQFFLKNRRKEDVLTTLQASEVFSLVKN